MLAAREAHGRASERRRHPLVGVVVVAVVVNKLLVVLVRGAVVADQLEMSARREVFQRACMVKGARGGGD